jgi:hypothetical protein
MKTTPLLGILCLSLVTACASTVSTTPRTRVARDLGCTADQTTVERLPDFRWQVTGCGHTAVYLCTYPVRDCWREGEIHEVDIEDEPARAAMSSP